LVVVRTSKDAGSIHLTATTPNLSPGTTDVEAKASDSSLELH
jgi:hypothetical protein